MYVSAAFLVKLTEEGKVKSVVIEADREREGMWVAQVDEYQEPHTAPLYFVDPKDGVLHKEMWAQQDFKQLGKNYFREIADRCFEFNQEWRLTAGFGRSIFPGVTASGKSTIFKAHRTKPRSGSTIIAVSLPKHAVLLQDKLNVSITIGNDNTTTKAVKMLEVKLDEVNECFVVSLLVDLEDRPRINFQGAFEVNPHLFHQEKSKKTLTIKGADITKKYITVLKPQHNQIEALCAQLHSLLNTILHPTTPLPIQDSGIMGFLVPAQTVLRQYTEALHACLAQTELSESKISHIILQVENILHNRVELVQISAAAYLERLNAIEFLAKIGDVYSQLKNFFIKDNLMITEEIISNEHLYAEQKFCEMTRVQENLHSCLRQLGPLLLNQRIPRRCFISYAWPNQPARSSEKEVQKFLSILYAHFQMVGIPLDLDIRVNKEQGIYQYMDRITNSDVIIVVGTESLLEKHNQGTTAVCNELLLINRARAAGSAMVIPILLSGTPATAFPPYFSMYHNIVDWRRNAYVKNLQELLRLMCRIGQDPSDYSKHWEKTLFDQFPALAEPFNRTQVKQFQATFAASERQRKKAIHDQFGTLLGSVGQRLQYSTRSCQTQSILFQPLQQSSWMKNATISSRTFVAATPWSPYLSTACCSTKMNTPKQAMGIFSIALGSMAAIHFVSGLLLHAHCAPVDTQKSTLLSC